MHTFNLEHCTYSPRDRRVIRWLEPVRRPETDEEWDDLVALEDAEEAEAFSAMEAHEYSLSFRGSL